MAIKWAIIGAGRYASNVTAPAIAGVADAQLVAVSDVSLERATELAATHNVEKVFDTLEPILEDPDIDIVYISTPHNLHAVHTREAAKAGKHVFCEKPMALTVPEAEQMIEDCEKNNVKLGVSFPERYHPAHIEARRYSQSGDAGNIEVVHAQFCRGGSSPISWRGWRSDPSISGAGALYATGLHPTDLLRFVLNSEIEEIRALTDANPPQSPLETMIYAILTFQNGTRGVILTGALAPRSETSLILYGSKAKITLKDTIWGLQKDDMGELMVDGDSVNLKMTFPTDSPLSCRMMGEIEAFQSWIAGGAEPQISWRNGLQMVKVANAILQSSREGKAVKV